MKKMMVLAMVVFVAGCSGLAGLNSLNLNFLKGKTKKPAVVSEITTRHCELKPFKTILAKRSARVELVNGPYAMDITGINLAAYPCRGSVVGKTLYIGNIGSEASNVVVKVSAPMVKKITVMDRATVSAKDFKAEGLMIVAKERGAVNLEGAVNLRKIVQYGKGRINVGWAYGKDLRIEGYNSGPITLAGRIDNMVVKLVNDAKLYARYLRANKASVFTTNRSLAEVLVLDNLGAYAVDHSNIYYYKKPDDITIVTRDSANVLSPEKVI